MHSSMKLWSLSSSSVYGNSCLISGHDTHILIDCGMSLKRLTGAILETGIEPDDVDALFLTHEHGDHTRSLALKKPYPVRYEVPAYGTQAFWDCWYEKHPPLPTGLCETVEPGGVVVVGEFEIKAVRKQHDAIDPVGFIVSNGDKSIGVVTDLGCVSDELHQELYGVDALLFESNHCPEMEISSQRPWFLINRVMGELGHLSNIEAGKALREIVTDRTQSIVLGHLSCDCNCPDHARAVVGDMLFGRWQGQLMVAPDRGLMCCEVD